MFKYLCQIQKKLWSLKCLVSLRLDMHPVLSEILLLRFSKTRWVLTKIRKYIAYHTVLWFSMLYCLVHMSTISCLRGLSNPYLLFFRPTKASCQKTTSQCSDKGTSQWLMYPLQGVFQKGQTSVAQLWCHARVKSKYPPTPPDCMGQCVREDLVRPKRKSRRKHGLQAASINPNLAPT